MELLNPPYNMKNLFFIFATMFLAACGSEQQKECSSPCCDSLTCDSVHVVADSVKVDTTITSKK